jgi:hypothetical protein
MWKSKGIQYVVVSLVILAVTMCAGCGPSNHSPEITSLTPGATSVAPGENCTIACVASDPDGDTLTYEWTATGGTISGEGDTVTWTAPAAEGSCTIGVTVSDGKGGTDSDTCAVAVEVKVGSIDVKSNPAGAAVYLDGEDTESITPYVITNVEPGNHTIKLVLSHYKYREGTLVVNADETSYINWELTYVTEQTLTIQPGASAGKDTYACNSTPGDNFGSNEHLFAGCTATDIWRTYIEFDLGDIPENAVVVNASVGLYCIFGGGPAEHMGAYKMEEAWTEGGVTWDNQPASAATPEYTCTLPPAAGFFDWYIGDLVSGWLDGSIANYGIMLEDIDECTVEHYRVFISSDYTTDVTMRPKLTVTYYDPTP